MKEVAYLAALLWTVVAVHGQSQPIERENPTTIKVTSNLVMVPTLVRTASAEIVSDLKAEDFKLIDNGVEQKISVEKVEKQPVAVAVLMQTGGVAFRQFQNYSTMNMMLTLLPVSSSHRVGIVTFDSHPEEIWNFPPMADGLQYAFSHPASGDRGAAILDAVNLGIEMLQQQPASFRRIIVLLSQARDCGSKTPAIDVVRNLGQSNVTIYSVTYSPKKGLPGVELSAPCSLTSATQLSSDRVPVGMPQPPESLGAILKAMGDDTAAEVASLSGGGLVRFDSKKDLERELSILADYFSNSYTLSFRPASKEAGLHFIRVEVAKRRGPLNVAARRIYWLAETADGR